MTLGVLGAAAPAQAAVYADCTVGIGSNDNPYISCGDVVGGQARGRADCAWAPDTYTNWVRAWQSSVGGGCLFSARGAIMETRAG